MRSQKISPEIYHYNDINASKKEVSKYELLRQYLPYIQILSDGKTIITKNNTLIRTVKIIGFDSSNISTEEMENISNMKDNLFSFMSEKIHLNFYTIRRVLPEIHDDEQLFKKQYANEINKIWNSGFQDSFITEIYLTVSCNFPDLTKKSQHFKANLNSARKDLDNHVTQVKSLLHKFVPLDLNNKNHNELFKFYSYLINCHDFNNKNEEELFNQFSLSDIAFNSSSGLIKSC